MSKSKVFKVSKFVSINLLLLAIMLPFQNCSEVAFTPGLDEQGKTGLGDGTTCVDRAGAVHQNGDTFVTETPSQTQLACPSGPTRTQSYINRQEWTCSAGTLVPGQSMVIPNGADPACPAPVLQVSATPVVVPYGSNTVLAVHSEYVSQVSYSCSSAAGQPAFVRGALQVGDASVAVPVTQDIYCLVEGTNAAGTRIQADVSVSVSCGLNLKENGVCKDFGCKQIQAIAPNPTTGIIDVPARNGNGICYAVKLMNPISPRDTNMTGTSDGELLSRRHGDLARSDENGAPYVLATAKMNFVLNGNRTVRLNGSANALTDIQVDNYVLVGIIPLNKLSSPAESQVPFYRAYGTADATIYGTNHILFRNQPVSLKPFGAGGTSSITPLDITGSITPGQGYQLDLRALDCGGMSALSDIFVLFQ